MPRKSTSRTACTAAQHRTEPDDLPVTQRSVPASAAGKPTVNRASSSVFAFGAAQRPKQRAPRLPPLNPEEVIVRSGIPLPPPRAGNGPSNRYRELLRKMAVGDSVQLPLQHARTLMRIGADIGMKMTSRTVAEGVYGVWRVK